MFLWEKQFVERNLCEIVAKKKLYNLSKSEINATIFFFQPNFFFSYFMLLLWKFLLKKQQNKFDSLSLFFNKAISIHKYCVFQTIQKSNSVIIPFTKPKHDHQQATTHHDRSVWIFNWRPHMWKMHMLRTVHLHSTSIIAT